MRMLFRHHLYSIVSLALSACAAVLAPVAAFGDHAMTLGLTFLDTCFPLATIAAPGVGSHPLRPTREVTYLTTGLHRLAQPLSLKIGDADDDGDDDEEEITSNSRRCRLNC